MYGQYRTSFSYDCGFVDVRDVAKVVVKILLDENIKTNLYSNRP